VGGDIHFIDTEARRALHYADQFKFKHIEFNAPFASLDYLDAIRQSKKDGAGVIVIDSMSHEHEGPGGLVDFHEVELTRMAGDDYGKRDRMTMLAWQKPKAARRQLLNGIVQLGVNAIICFRAGEKTKPIKQPDGKLKPVEMGFTPIAGPEFVYEMTACAMLYPRSDGVPAWNSDLPGERIAMKLPLQFRELLADGKPLSEEHGRRMALWARGDGAKVDNAGPAQTGRPIPGGQQLPLAQRTEAYLKRIADAPNPVKLEAIGRAAAALKADLDASDPERLVEVEEIFAARLRKLEEEAYDEVEA
jgi:hypothetical protein